MIANGFDHRIWFLNINSIDNNINMIVYRFLLTLVKKIKAKAISPGRLPGMQFFQGFED
jgi:hypothetical protein